MHFTLLSGKVSENIAMSEFSHNTGTAFESDPWMEQQEDYKETDLLDRLINYDAAAPEAEHLRPRQSLAVTKFCEFGAQMLLGQIPTESMSVIHPTGSGKTVLATELARIVASEPTGHNVLMLVPSLQLLGQTVGRDADIGEIRSRLPELSVGEYSGVRRSTDNQITIMNYHMLKGAIKKGDLARIDPKLIILDEMHHLIDGSWSEDVQEATKDILTVGLTATPLYSDKRDSRTNFPVVLDQMTMRDGIREGILSGVRGFTYKGSSKIVLRNPDGKLTDEDIFQALATSKDNYLAAAICASEVAKGKRGIVSCTPGMNRLHAKVMQRILSQTPVDTPEGRRFINAAYVDGTMDKSEVARILDKYHRDKPEIDVICFVSLLLEGWNSPQTDFGVWARPTPSVVLAEQRIGRLLRRRGNKVAHIHEIIYDIEGGSDMQITLDDVLNGTGARIGYSVGKPAVGPRNRSESFIPNVDVSRLAINAELAAEIGEAPVATHEEVIAPEQDIVPYDWPTLHVLAKKFGTSYEDTEQVLMNAGVTTTQDSTSDIRRIFYSPDSYKVLANHSGINVGIPEGYVTVADIIYYCKTSELQRIVKIEDLEEHLASLDFQPMFCLDKDKIVKTYPEDAQNLLSLVPGRTIPKNKHKKEQVSVPQIDIVNWLSVILVNPKTAETPLEKRHIVTAQSCLLNVLRNDKICLAEDIQRLTEEAERLRIEPSAQMKSVMATNNLDFARLLILATRAKDHWMKAVG